MAEGLNLAVNDIQDINNVARAKNGKHKTQFALELQKGDQIFNLKPIIPPKLSPARRRYIILERISDELTNVLIDVPPGASSNVPSGADWVIYEYDTIKLIPGQYLLTLCFSELFQQEIDVLTVEIELRTTNNNITDSYIYRVKSFPNTYVKPLIIPHLQSFVFVRVNSNNNIQYKSLLMIEPL